MVLLRNGTAAWLVLAIIAAVLRVRFGDHPVWLANLHTPISLQHVAIVLDSIITMLVITGILAWQSQSFQIADGYLVVQTLAGLHDDHIPLHAIQNIQVTRSLLGMLLGFGTVTVDSGRVEVALPFVPDCEAFVSRLHAARA